jgi:hypothetical protein
MVGMRSAGQEEEQAMRLGKKPRMRRAILLLLAGVMLSCLGSFLSLPQTTASEVPMVPATPAEENGGDLTLPSGRIATR